jgi:hypothetical protein
MAHGVLKAGTFLLLQDFMTVITTENDENPHSLGENLQVWLKSAGM